jgi:hypothetical protein
VAAILSGLSSLVADLENGGLLITPRLEDSNADLSA